MKTVISAVLAFVIGAGGMYLLGQGPLTTAQNSIAALETQLSEAKTSAEASASASATEIADVKSKADAAAAELNTALEAKTQEATTLAAKVTELQAALASAKAAAVPAQ